MRIDVYINLCSVVIVSLMIQVIQSLQCAFCSIMTAGCS